MLNFEKVSSLDGVANRFRFVATDEQIAQIRERTSLSEYSVKSALKLTGAPSTVTRVVLELANSSSPIALL